MERDPVAWKRAAEIREAERLRAGEIPEWGEVIARMRGAKFWSTVRRVA